MIKEEAQQKALATIWRSEMGGEAWVWVCVYGGGLLWRCGFGAGIGWDGMLWDKGGYGLLGRWVWRVGLEVGLD